MEGEGEAEGENDEWRERMMSGGEVLILQGSRSTGTHTTSSPLVHSLSN